MTRTRLAAAITIASLAAASLGAGAALAACGSTGTVPAATATPGGSGYSYYRAMMGRFSASSGGMMGGTSSRGSMMTSTGYSWMMGGSDAPAWKRGSVLPGYMMSSSRDPGTIMGALFANAPGTRVSPAQAALLGRRMPAGATASSTGNRITFSAAGEPAGRPGRAGPVVLAVLASPAGGPGQRFRIGGMVDPTIVVRAGARVSIELINADPGTAQGLAITVRQASTSSMPMMTARLAFPGSAAWFLGNPTTAGMHAATLSFTAATPGIYQYLSPVPGHAQAGMTGTFIVSRG
jgi:uncharacterized cupredoxin-like copper-binding protein